MNTGARWAAIHGIAKSQTRLSNSHTHTHTHTKPQITHVIISTLKMVTIRHYMAQGRAPLRVALCECSA